MIQLTRLNRSSVTVNSDLIKLIEQAPDTVITLVNGEKLLVRESIGEILDRIVKFRRSIAHGPGSADASGLVAGAASETPNQAMDSSSKTGSEHAR